MTYTALEILLAGSFWCPTAKLSETSKASSMQLFIGISILAICVCNTQKIIFKRVQNYSWILTRHPVSEYLYRAHWIEDLGLYVSLLQICHERHGWRTLDYTDPSGYLSEINFLTWVNCKTMINYQCALKARHQWVSNANWFAYCSFCICLFTNNLPSLMLTKWSLVFCLKLTYWYQHIGVMHWRTLTRSCKYMLFMTVLSYENALCILCGKSAGSYYTEYSTNYLAAILVLCIFKQTQRDVYETI